MVQTPFPPFFKRGNPHLENTHKREAHKMYMKIRGKLRREVTTQPAITCSELTVETLEQGEKYAQS